MNSQPYTHVDHAINCRDASLAGVVLAGKLVQVQKRGVIYCARIASAWTTPDGADLWTVESFSPERARFSVPVRFVRDCGDVQCVCTPVTRFAAAQKEGTRASGELLFDAARPGGFDGFSGCGFSQAGVVAPPESPDFGNLPKNEAF